MGEGAANIAIVGGGPSGLLMAIALARRGIRTTLFERDLHPELAPTAKLGLSIFEDAKTADIPYCAMIPHLNEKAPRGAPFAPEPLIEAEIQGLERYKGFDDATLKAIERDNALALFPRLNVMAGVRG